MSPALSRRSLIAAGIGSGAALWFLSSAAARATEPDLAGLPDLTRDARPIDAPSGHGGCHAPSR